MHLLELASRNEVLLYLEKERNFLYIHIYLYISHIRSFNEYMDPWLNN